MARQRVLVRTNGGTQPVRLVVEPLTRPEALQSLNEELMTVNAELQDKIEELARTHDDMHNLLDSTQIATIFLDNDLRIKRFTPAARQIVSLIDTDIGRPLDDLASNLEQPGLVKAAADVLRHLTPTATEVKTRAGQWFVLRIIPYRTTDNVIDGAVMTFTDIGAQKQAQQKLIELRDKAATVPNPRRKL